MWEKYRFPTVCNHFNSNIDFGKRQLKMIHLPSLKNRTTEKMLSKINKVKRYSLVFICIKLLFRFYDFFKNVLKKLNQITLLPRTVSAVRVFSIRFCGFYKKISWWFLCQLRIMQSKASKFLDFLKFFQLFSIFFRKPWTFLKKRLSYVM